MKNNPEKNVDIIEGELTFKISLLKNKKLKI